MNELQARRLLVEALGGTGPIGNDRDFWTTTLTALNGGVFSSANNEHEFWGKFATGLASYQPDLPDDQSIVTDEDSSDLYGAEGTTSLAPLTLEVTEGVVYPRLPDDVGVVEDGDILNVSGGTVTITVTDNVVTAEFNPE